MELGPSGPTEVPRHVGANAHRRFDGSLHYVLHAPQATPYADLFVHDESSGVYRPSAVTYSHVSGPVSGRRPLAGAGDALESSRAVTASAREALLRGREAARRILDTMDQPVRPRRRHVASGCRWVKSWSLPAYSKKDRLGAA